MYQQSHRPDSYDGPRAATVCRRGHEQQITLTAAPTGDLGFCNECGASVIGRCPACGVRIRGMEGGLIGAMTPYLPPKFCDGCGEPLPWAGRQDYIYQLENLLDVEEIDQPTRLLVLEDLERLRMEVDLGEDKQAEIWKRIKDRAPGLFTGSAMKIIQSLINAYVVKRLGL
jgi:hypothetical protein